MKQLSGVDASFLYMETPSMFGHVSGLAMFRRRWTPNGLPSKRCATESARGWRSWNRSGAGWWRGPARPGPPYWILDPDFDLELLADLVVEQVAVLQKHFAG